MLEMYQKFKSNRELKKALKIVWLLSTVCVLAVLVTVFFIDEETVLSAVPACSAKTGGLECFLCGSSRAFFKLKYFDWESARSLNPYSVYFFLSFLVNIILTTINLRKLTSNLFI